MKINLFVAGCLFLAGVVTTQAQVELKAQVPFPFGVVNKTLPAGEYVVWSEHEKVLLRTGSGELLAIVLSNRSTHDGGPTGQLVFHCSQDRCFLAELWTSDGEQGREILESKAEKEVAKQEKPQLFVLLGKGSE